MSLLRFYPIAVFFNLFILSLIYLFIPALRFSLIAENQFLENLTAIFYFDSFVLGLLFFAQIKNKEYCSIYILVPILSLLGFLDEISFGQELFSLEMPVVGRTRIDGIHDLLSLAKDLVSPIKSNFGQFLRAISLQFPGIYQELIFLGKIFILFSLGLMVLLVAQKHQKIIGKTQSFLRHYPPFQFILLAVGFGVVSQAIDLRLIHHQLLASIGSFVEEAFETNIALSMLFSSFAIRNIKTRKSFQDDETSQFVEVSGEVTIHPN